MEANKINMECAESTSGRLCNLEELIIGNDGNLVDIVIPKIQRAYAQGRKREVNLREQFISQLLEALAKGESMELNFVYGSKTCSNGHTVFELLDGQQRLTTLFLLYWYFTMAEGGKHAVVPEFLKHFSYETRATSSDFIQKLTNSVIDVSTCLPSESICSKQWYTISFDKDSTVEGMLTMLDCIHIHYQKMGRPSDMLANLNKIKFYELDLKDFGLTEEIYIKMNARGLQLTPFENFKADLVKYMKNEKNSHYKENVKLDIIGRPEAPYYISFSQKMDSKWLNLFWSKQDEDSSTYCDKFFRFFYRYFSTKYFLEVRKDMNAMDFRPNRDEIWDFLWTLSQTQSSSMNKTYLGFTHYQTILDLHPEYIQQIELILDTLCKDEIKDLLDEALHAPWDKTWHRCFFEEDYGLQDAVLFGAITEFIEVSQGNIKLEELKHWIRIVWNTIENQLYRNINELVSTVRNFSEIIHTSGATDHVYTTLATFIEKKDYPRSLREEIKKAVMIVKQPNQQWETAFIQAEKHPFFRGAIGYFLFAIEPKSAEQFRHRAEMIGSLFDDKGIASEFRKDHLLMMAMIRQLNTPDKMGIKSDGTVNLSITENVDKLNHLKSLLIDKSAIHELLCRIGDLPTLNDIVQELQQIVSEDIEFECEREGNDLYGKITRAFRRLASDKKLYDFIRDEEDSNHILEFMFLDRWHYAVNKKRSWYSKFFIESERNLIIPALIEQEGYQLEEASQKRTYKDYGDYFGYDVWVQKTIVPGKVLHINFCRGDIIDFCLYEPSEAILQHFDVETDDNGWAQLCRINYATKAHDYKRIVKKIHDIENIIQEKS